MNEGPAGLFQAGPAEPPAKQQQQSLHYRATDEASHLDIKRPFPRQSHSSHSISVWAPGAAYLLGLSTLSLDRESRHTDTVRATKRYRGFAIEFGTG
jgi:hypothetical protein